MADGDGQLPESGGHDCGSAPGAGPGAGGRSGQPSVRTGPVELEFEVAVTRTGGGQAGVQLWVLTLGGKGELANATTQRIKVTLQPVNPETGTDAQVTDARRGPEPAGPPP